MRNITSTQEEVPVRYMCDCGICALFPPEQGEPRTDGRKDVQIVITLERRDACIPYEPSPAGSDEAFNIPTDILQILTKVMARQVDERTGEKIMIGPEKVIPIIIPGGTDASKYRGNRIKAPHCLGFCPLRLLPGMDFASMFHAQNERVPVEGFKWGTKVLMEAVGELGYHEL